MTNPTSYTDERVREIFSTLPGGHSVVESLLADRQRLQAEVEARAAFMADVQKRIAAVSPPETMTSLRREYWKAGAGAVIGTHAACMGYIAAINAAPQPPEGARVVPDGWMWFSADLSCLCNAINQNPRAIVGLVRDHAGQAWWHSLSEEDKETTGLYVYADAPTFELAFELACNLTKKEIAAPTLAGKEG